MTVLLALLTILALPVGFTRAQKSELLWEPGESDVRVQSEELDGHITRVAANSYDFLAIGAPGEDMAIFLNTYADAGAVNVVYGSVTGITFDGNQFWHQNSTGIEGVLEHNDKFGQTLAAYYRVKPHTVYLKPHTVYVPLVRRD